MAHRDRLTWTSRGKGDLVGRRRVLRNRWNGRGGQGDFLAAVFFWN